MTQVKVYYCAWCEHIRDRKQNVFYSSKICDKHLQQLKEETQKSKMARFDTLTN